LEACARDLWSAEPGDTKATELIEAVTHVLSRLYTEQRGPQRHRHIFSAAKYLRGQAQEQDPGDSSLDDIANFFVLEREQVADIMQQAEEYVDRKLGKLPSC